MDLSTVTAISFFVMLFVVVFGWSKDKARMEAMEAQIKSDRDDSRDRYYRLQERIDGVCDHLGIYLTVEDSQRRIVAHKR